MITILATHDNASGSTVKLAKVSHLYDVIWYHNNGQENLQHLALVNIASEQDAWFAYNQTVAGLTS